MLIDFFLIKLHTCTYRHFRVVYTNLKEKNQCFQKMLTFIPGFRSILKTHPVSRPPLPPKFRFHAFSKMLRCFSANSITFALLY